MTVLLDTHVWLWAFEAPDKLGRRTKALLLKSANDRLARYAEHNGLRLQQQIFTLLKVEIRTRAKN
jgi:hypothetical protein